MKTVYFRMITYLIGLIFSLLFIQCGDESAKNDIAQEPILPDSLLNQNPYDSTFLPGMPVGLIENDELSEASGIAAGRVNLSILWAHNDSGDLPRLFLVKEDGGDAGTVLLKGVNNYDWEDMAIQVLEETGESLIYIADIGDNGLNRSHVYIHVFKEPQLTPGNDPVDIEVDNIIAFTVKYPEEAKNAETLLVDPITHDIYIISKEAVSAGIYLLSNPVSGTDNILTLEATLPIGTVVGGDISSDGNEILLKTYTSVFYWRRNEGETIIEALTREPKRLAYFREPQGESIAFKEDLSGYYTISEEPANIEANLIYYRRNE